ncbi:MAG TPA: VWA domain-containing protein [Pyrinomonadaceae bacterium]|nr:VWA domain-containing protein [Pyrinomonadaceae bacterium]
MTSVLRLLLISIAIVICAAGAARAQAPQASPSPKTSTRQPTPINQEPDADIVRVETDLVNTLFTAVDKDHHFVTSLKLDDVRIYENDIPQTISLFQRETDRPLSLAILIDTSASQEHVLAEEKRAARAFVDSVIRPGIDRAAILSFTGVPKLEQGLSSDLGRLRQGIDRVRVEMSPENERRLAMGEDPLPIEQDPSGYTSIWDAMWTTIQDHLLKSPTETRRAIILLSDGDDTSSRLGKQDVIDYAVRSEVVVYAIGIRDRDFPEGKLDAGALRKVSDRTGGRAFIPSAASELPQAFSQIDQELRSQYLIAYSPTNKNRDGSYRHVRIEIVNPELRQQKLHLLYRQGYYGKSK